MQIQPKNLRERLDAAREILSARGRIDRFYDDLAASWFKYGSLTERQEAALVKSLDRFEQFEARRTQERAARVITSPIPTGRVTIVGRVVSTKWVENDFGGALKMLVESEQGWRVYGTVPARLGEVLARTEGTLVGSKVSFTAAVTPKEADFGFYSRPTGAAVLSDEQPQPAAAPVTHRQEPQLDAPAPAPVPNVIIDNGPDANWTPAKHEARLTGLAAMVAAAGY
jgi:hypothetical protein